MSGGKLWWADEEGAQLGTVNKRDGRNPAVLRNKTSGVVHMKVYDREGQKGEQHDSRRRTSNHLTSKLTFMSANHSGRNQCQVNNGGCSQLCFPTSENTRSCSCTLGYKLRTDRMSCEGDRPFYPYVFEP